MQTRLFDPVGMTNTYLNYMVDKESIDLAKPYKLDNREFREVDLDVHVSWMKEAGGAGMSVISVGPTQDILVNFVMS